MTWNDELDELRLRTSLAEAMGGEEKVARQHEFGKLTIRERIDEIADDHSFHCLLYTSPSPRDRTRSRMPSSA